MNIKSYPPGLIVVMHDDVEAIEEFFEHFPPTEAQALSDEGYHIVGLVSSFTVEHYSDEQLKELGLKRISKKAAKTRH